MSVFKEVGAGETLRKLGYTYVNDRWEAPARDPSTGAFEALTTLRRLGYTYEGGAEWKPPLGKAPDYVAIPDDPRAAHLHHVRAVANEDADGLIKGDPKYGYSWKKRGGVGAYMMIVRKADRLDHALSPAPANDPAFKIDSSRLGVWLDKPIPAWDIFAALAADTRAEGTIDDVRDLRRYLLLVEAEMRARSVDHGEHRDNAS